MVLGLCVACDDTAPSDAPDAFVADDAGPPIDAAEAGTTTRDAARDDAAGRECPPPSSPRAFLRGSENAHPLDDTLRLNELQAKATHNSYHVPSTENAGEWDYTHAPIDEQLARQGVRGLELDVHWDASCERYEVFHIGLLDEATTCRVLTDCLALVRTFSERNPGHHPIFVQIEPKDAASSVTEDRLRALEREILSVFEPEWIITPDEVRAGAATLADGIRTNGWPTLAASRGRLLFYLDDSSAAREVYTRGGRDLDERLMFVDSEIDAPYAAVFVLNDPVGDAPAIAEVLARGYLVRTRADSSPVDVRAGASNRDAALASGAQIVTTDFPAPTAGLDYFVDIPGGTPSRCSPVTARSDCASLAIEDPARLAR